MTILSWFIIRILFRIHSIHSHTNHNNPWFDFPNQQTPGLYGLSLKKKKGLCKFLSLRLLPLVFLWARGIRANFIVSVVEIINGWRNDVGEKRRVDQWRRPICCRPKVSLLDHHFLDFVIFKKHEFPRKFFLSRLYIIMNKRSWVVSLIWTSN